ncbi:MAG: DNA-directed RNA polymerase subunit H [Candidatus Micrarchaeota archaeon]
MPQSHYLVPEVSLLPTEEADKVIAELGTKKEYLPWIKVTDPMIKDLQVQEGDVVKVSRKSAFVKEGVSFYRLVVA